MEADKYIIEFFNWCHANPIFVGSVISAAAWVAARTKGKWDDGVIDWIKKALGHRN